jgi:hypothetical protein
MHNLLLAAIVLLEEEKRSDMHHCPPVEFMSG